MHSHVQSLLLWKQSLCRDLDLLVIESMLLPGMISTASKTSKACFLPAIGQDFSDRLIKLSFGERFIRISLQRVGFSDNILLVPSSLKMP